MSLGGLIGAALKGGGEGYAAAAKSEMEQQQKIDYQAKYLQMLEEKERRIAEFSQDLDVQGIPRRAIATAQGNAAARGINLATDAQYLDQEADLGVRKDVAGITAARNANLPQLKAQFAADTEGAGYDAALTADLPSKKAKLKGADLAANKPNVEEEASQAGAAEGTKQVSKTKTPGYLGSVSSETGAKESPSARAANSRAQDDWNRSAKAREAVAEYTAALDDGNEEGAKAARLKAIKLGVDPGATKRGQMKVVKNDDGTESLVYEDSNGNVSSIDPKTLQPYEPKSMPKVAGGGIPEPKTADELAKLKPGTQYKAPDGTIRTKRQ